MEETLSKFMSEWAKVHEENSNMIKEIRASMDAAVRNQRASIKTLEIQIGQIIDTYSIRHMGSSGYAVSTPQNSTLMYETRQTTIPFLSRLNDYYCKEKKGSYGPQFLKAYSYEASHIDTSIPRKEKDPENFLVLEDMDAYRDEGIGDVIFGEPFLREIGINARWFDGMITIYNGNDEVSEEDKMNGISHSYQKLKGFYKGVVNLGPDFIRVPTMEEWLTRGHISVHEMEW
ncbi:hypothetical protein Tco_1369581 [Tanacetum coccineum]